MKSVIHDSNKDLFNHIVGQTPAKKALDFYLDSYYATKLFPNMMMVAAKGNGKTTLCKAAAKGLVLFDESGKPVMKEDGKTFKKKAFVEINCSSIKNLNSFVNGIFIPHIQDKDCTILFDEASELPKDVTMALLTMLNPNPTNKNIYIHDEHALEVDFKKQTFLFATSEIQKVFHALADRLERIDLQEYSDSEMATIVQKSAPEVKFNDNVLEDVATVLRGNGRAAQKMADKILVYLKNRGVFGRKDWANLRNILGILPLGLSPIELSVLRYLKGSTTGTPLTMLSAKTGMSRDALQKDVEMYLQKKGLMSITTSGREITSLGLEYLKKLDKESQPVLKPSAKVDLSKV
jgi:Holliday junction resolvasome RuvABC ATP-dependent DNA helicase subunit